MLYATIDEKLNVDNEINLNIDLYKDSNGTIRLNISSQNATGEEYPVTSTSDICSRIRYYIEDNMEA